MGEVFKREVDAVLVASGNVQVARRRGADREDKGVVRASEVGGGDVRTDLDARHKHDALGFEKGAAALDEGLVELEAGDAVAEESADIGVFLINRYLPTLATERDGGGKPRRTRADDGDGLPVLVRRRTRLDPAVRESGLDDVLFRLADHHGFLVELVDAARLAEGGADAGGELREVGMPAQKFVGAMVVAVRDGAVLVGDEIAERATVGMAEGLPAVHAARDLLADVVRRKAAFDFPEVVATFVHVAVDVVNAAHGRVVKWVSD